MNGISKKLLGHKLDGGWEIVAPYRMRPGGTGGCFSHGFLARDAAGVDFFVKVLDIRLNPNVSDSLKDLQLRIQRFTYEKDIALSCADDRLSRVAHAVGHGVLRIGPAGGEEEFPYLVFERAAGNLRHQVERARSLPVWISYRVLHNVAAGIRQLHGKNIAHQDVKPSSAGLSARRSQAG